MPSGAPRDDSSPRDRLPCGVPVDDLLAQVTDGKPPQDPAHQRSCAHCRATLAEVRDIWSPVQELAAEHVRAPTGLLDAVMARVRELSRHPWYSLVPGPNGHTRIASRVLEAIARLAAESVPRVGLALGQGHESGADVGVAGTHVVIDIYLSVELGAPIPEIADQVRAQIRRHLWRDAGLVVVEVNVTIVDVEAPRSRSGPDPLPR